MKKSRFIFLFISSILYLLFAMFSKFLDLKYYADRNIAATFLAGDDWINYVKKLYDNFKEMFHFVGIFFAIIFVIVMITFVVQIIINLRQEKNKLYRMQIYKILNTVLLIDLTYLLTILAASFVFTFAFDYDDMILLPFLFYFLLKVIDEAIIVILKLTCKNLSFEQNKKLWITRYVYIGLGLPVVIFYFYNTIYLMNLEHSYMGLEITYYFSLIYLFCLLIIYEPIYLVIKYKKRP